MFAVTVLFQVEPSRRDEFRVSVLRNARLSLEEPGCRRFDVCFSAHQERCFLYELYDDEAAFESHKTTRHFRAFDDESRELVSQKTVETFRLEPSLPKALSGAPSRLATPSLQSATGVLLGAIADDYTGATDLAGMLSAQGVRTVLLLGAQPEAVLKDVAPHYQAVVVALNCRSLSVPDAQRASLAALRQLQRLRPRQIYFKYCSTFDSTSEGNIGPVTEALMQEMAVDFTVAVPALPVNGRTQYRGHLFVDDKLLSESPLRHHPIHPMTDSNLVRHLQAQTSRRVGLVDHAVVRAGAGPIAAEIERLRSAGIGIALVDVLEERDLEAIAAATESLPLVTGASGLGGKLVANWRESGCLMPREAMTPPLPWRARRAEPGGSRRVLLIAGSCSARTLEQVQAFRAAGCPTVRIDPRALLYTGADAEMARVTEEVLGACAISTATLVYSSISPDERSALLSEASSRGIDADALRRGIERALAVLAARAVEDGIRKLLVAGGESAAAVLDALNVQALEVGEVLEPGIPHCRTMGDPTCDLVLKSGNFGGPDFFLKAARFLGEEAAR